MLKYLDKKIPILIPHFLVFTSAFICIFLITVATLEITPYGTYKNFTSAAIKIAHHFFLVKTFVVTDPCEVHRVYS